MSGGQTNANDEYMQELYEKRREAELDAAGEKALTARVKLCQLCRGAVTLFFVFRRVRTPQWQVVCDKCKMAGPICSTAKKALSEWNRLTVLKQKKKRVS